MATRKQTRKAKILDGAPNVGLKVKEDEVSFVASLAPISGPVKMDWEGEYRVTLAVPRAERTAMFKLQCLTEVAFDVVLHPRIGSIQAGDGETTRKGGESDEPTSP